MTQVTVSGEYMFLVAELPDSISTSAAGRVLNWI